MSRFRASAPGRAGIVGNPSDIYGGVVVSASVPMRATCTLIPSDDWILPEDTTLWDAAIRRFPLDRPYRVVWETEVPRSSGVSGSTALLAATVLSVLQARGEAPSLETVEDRTAIGELVRDIERFDAGIMCGYQDAQMVAHGGVQRMEFAGKHPEHGGPAPQVQPLAVELPFLLVTTGVERLSGSVHGPIKDRWLRGEREVLDAVERITELGKLGAEAIASANWPVLASLMNENQAIQAHLGGSGEAIDQLVEKCLEGGAMAAKLAGAGLGGTVIALSTDLDGLEERLRVHGYTRFARPCAGPGARVEPV